MKYLEIAKTNFKNEAVYKTELLLGLISIFISMAVMYFIWCAIYSWNYSVVIGGLTLGQMLTYALISIFIARSTDIITEYEIEREVKYGGLVSILTKPVSYIKYRLSNESGFTGFYALTRGLPAFLIAVFIFGAFVPNLLTLGAFFIALFLGYLVKFFLSFITGLYAFWTVGSIWGIRKFREIVSNLFSGAFIPLYFFPEWFKSFAMLMPFQVTFHSPLSIYIGKATGQEIIFMLGLQVFWVIVLLAISCLAWKAAKKRFTALGG